MVARSPAAEAEVVADHHRHDAEGVDEHVLDEGAGLEPGELGVEAQHEGRVDPRLGEQLELLLDARERVGAEFGAQQAERIAVEGDGHHARVRVGRGDAGAVDDGAVTRVHPVELADHDDTRAEARRHLAGGAEDDHQLDPSSAAASGS